MFRPSRGRNSHGGININIAFVSIKCCIFQQLPLLPKPPHATLSFLIPVLLNFLEIQYQGKAFSPFQTHPKTMCVALASLLLYCLAYDIELRLSSSHLTPAYYVQVVRGGMGLFGSLLSVSLASVLFQDSVWLALYFLYILFLNRELLCNWLWQRMISNLPREPHLPERRILPV